MLLKTHLVTSGFVALNGTVKAKKNHNRSARTIFQFKKLLKNIV